jgi:hypothetical protein
MEFRKLSKISIDKKGRSKAFHIVIKLSQSSFYVIISKNWPFGTQEPVFINLVDILILTRFQVLTIISPHQSQKKFQNLNSLNITMNPTFVSLSSESTVNK